MRDVTLQKWGGIPMTPEEIRATDTRLIQRFIDSGELTWAQVEEARAQDPNRYNSVEVSVSSIPQPAPLPIIPRALRRKGKVEGKIQLLVAGRPSRVASPLPSAH
jgi:hypothetical protein